MIKDNLFKKAAFMKNKTLFLSLMVVLIAAGVWIALAADELTAVTINHPINDENISGSYTFSASTDATADNVTFYYCNATNCYSTCVNDTAGTAFNCTFDTSGISDGTYDINATAFNSTGENVSAATPITSITFDNTAPTVLNVSSTKADGLYTVGEEINITVTFSEAVTVTGTPNLELELGTTDRNATYLTGTDTTILTFNYTVLSGDNSDDLNYASTSALTAGTSIQDAAGNNATLTLPTGANSLAGNKAIVIQTALTVTVSSSEGTSTTASTTVISGTASGTGSNITNVTVNGHNASLTVATGAYSYTLDLTIGSNPVNVIAYDQVGNSGTNSLTVTRTAVVTSISSGGGTVSYTSVSEQGTSITLRKGYIKTLTVNKSYHTMKCIELGTDYITFQITSTPVTITLKLLESKSFDFDNDGYYDLYVKLDEIKSSTAYMTLKQIHEPVTAEAEEQPEEQPEETPEEAPEEVPEETPEEAPPEEKVPPEEEVPPAKLTWLWILVVLIIIGLVAYLFIYKKKKEY